MRRPAGNAPVVRVSALFSVPVALVGLAQAVSRQFDAKNRVRVQRGKQSPANFFAVSGLRAAIAVQGSDPIFCAVRAILAPSETGF
jgi:hypothetical protein